VALNPIIKFTTLFGLLAVELAVSMKQEHGPVLTAILAAVFILLSMVFVWRSFYRMRIGGIAPPRETVSDSEPRKSLAA
jgi:K(+)-stimulated pyrophosphate-energized sodium pump